MVFNKLSLLSYGKYDGLHRVFKLLMVNLDHGLFLQGYMVIKDKIEIIISRKLNELYDYSVIDSEDASKNAIFTENGNYTITVANDSVEGFPQMLDVTLALDFVEEPKKIVQDNKQVIELLKDKLEPMYVVNQPLAEYLFLMSYIEFKMIIASKTQIAPTPSKIVDMVLLKIYRSKPFLKMLSSNQDIVDTFLDALPTKVPLSVINVSKLYELLSNIVDNKNMTLKECSIFDIKYGLRLMDNMTIDNVMFLMKEAMQPNSKEIILDFTTKKETMKDKFEDVLLNFYRINHIKLVHNKELIVETDINPIYSDKFMVQFNSTAKFHISDKNIDILIDFNKPYVWYLSKDKTYETVTKSNQLLELTTEDNSLFDITLENK